ncbi:UPF0547 protein C16orf87 homolog [Agrilus planipennis]|uniref:UPF0547 protein C16orf87 homolog n=1 Tax=Agrilus planipennis TaxID=224129 RepID=A0A1W4X1R6_AGRPL|nr:UPF0547 protein C16orf87 homolog [Agrilus planipennis]
MKKHKMIAKCCPKCEQQVPVACKTCRCGYLFFNARRNSRTSSTSEDLRRTQRIRREKPNYYDALEYDKQTRKMRQRNSECENDDDKKETKTKKRKQKKEEEEEDEVTAHLSPEKQQHCSIILEELNTKLQLVGWKPT